MVSNVLLILLIITNSIVAIYVAYHLYLKIKEKCCGNPEENDPFADTDVYYKRLINDSQTEMEHVMSEVRDGEKRNKIEP